MEACHRKNKEVLCEHIPKKNWQTVHFRFFYKTEELERDGGSVCWCERRENERKRKRARASVVVFGMGGNWLTWLYERKEWWWWNNTVSVGGGGASRWMHIHTTRHFNVHHVSFGVSILHLISRVAVVFSLRNSWWIYQVLLYFMFSCLLYEMRNTSRIFLPTSIWNKYKKLFFSAHSISWA